MTNKEREKITILFSILSHALLEIREEAYNEKLAKTYKLSDLIHNLPSSLQQVWTGENELSIDDVYDTFERRSQNGNLTKWTANVQSQIKFE